MRRYVHPDLATVSLSQAMQALADPCRAAIVRAMLLAEGREMTCGEIPVGQSKATVSHHLEILRAAGVVRTRSEGTRCLSSVRREEFEARFPGLLGLLMAEGEAAAQEK